MKAACFPTSQHAVEAEVTTFQAFNNLMFDLADNI